MANKLDDLQKQIETLQKERDALLSKEKSVAIEDINTKIKAFGIQAKDLSFGNSLKAGNNGIKPRLVMKFKSGPNLWSGRGRKPKWVEDFLAKGGKLDEIRIK